jgi:molybdopterin converting factor small subunit
MNQTKVKVKIFGAPSLALESEEITLTLDQGSTAKDLLERLPLKNKDYLYVVRDGIRLTSSSKLNDGDEIIIVPPIAGGLTE